MPNLRSEFKTDRFDQLPLSRTCNRCGATKSREQMIIQHCRNDSGNYYYFRPLCKDCNNARERGHRRVYKTKYLQRWRRQNTELNESYWKGSDLVREAARVRAQNFTPEQKDAIAIQRRLRSRGEFVTIEDARELLSKYGRCYPTQFGLTLSGRKRCEQIRSRLRTRSRKNGSFGYRMMTSFEIRLMVYEESEEELHYLIPPDKQPVPYQTAAANLKRYWKKIRLSEAHQNV